MIKKEKLVHKELCHIAIPVKTPKVLFSGLLIKRITPIKHTSNTTWQILYIATAIIYKLRFMILS